MVSRACRRAGRLPASRPTGAKAIARASISVIAANSAVKIFEAFMRLPPGEALEIAEVGIDHMIKDLRSRAATTTGALPQFPTLRGRSSRVQRIPARGKNRQKATQGCLVRWDGVDGRRHTRHAVVRRCVAGHAFGNHEIDHSIRDSEIRHRRAERPPISRTIGAQCFFERCLLIAPTPGPTGPVQRGGNDALSCQSQGRFGFRRFGVGGSVFGVRELAPGSLYLDPSTYSVQAPMRRNFS